MNVYRALECGSVKMKDAMESDAEDEDSRNEVVYQAALKLDRE